MATFNVKEATIAQYEYCQRKELPHFAPRGGLCWRCNKNIYTEIDHGTYKTGISVEMAGSDLVTGCPHCHRSYCD